MILVDVCTPNRPSSSVDDDLYLDVDRNERLELQGRDQQFEDDFHAYRPSSFLSVTL